MPLNRICQLDDTATSIAPVAGHCLESPLQKNVLHYISVVWHRNSSYGLILILWSGAGFSTVALVPTVPWYWFRNLGSGTYFSIPGYSVQGFQRIIALFSFWYKFGCNLLPFRFQIRSNLMLWYWNQN